MADGEVGTRDGRDGLAPAPEASPAVAPAVRAALLEAAPEAVRGRVADLVSQAVGQMPATELPAPVRPVARFAPAKRAKVGAGPMLAAIGSAEGFADEVVTWWREHRPEEWTPPVAEPVHAAAVAVLTGDQEAARSLLRDAGERADVARLRAERDTAVTRADRLAAELERVTAERDEARAKAAGATPDLSDE